MCFFLLHLLFLLFHSTTPKMSDWFIILSLSFFFFCILLKILLVHLLFAANILQQTFGNKHSAKRFLHPGLQEGKEFQTGTWWRQNENAWPRFINGELTERLFCRSFDVQHLFRIKSANLRTKEGAWSGLPFIFPDLAEVADFDYHSKNNFRQHKNLCPCSIDSQTVSI